MTDSGSGCPLIGEQGFFVNMAVIGEMTSGKSTFLNAVFGDIIAQADIDRTTKDVIRYYESKDIKSNDNVLQDTIKTNAESDKKLNQDIKEVAKYKKRNFVAKWVLSWMNKVPSPNFQGKSTSVAESGLIPRKGN